MAESRATGCVRCRAWNRDRWLRYVRAWSAIGLTAVEYCQQERLHPSSFQRWRRIFGESGEALSDSERSAEGESAGALFAQVEVASSGTALDAQTIEVVLAPGSADLHNSLPQTLTFTTDETNQITLIGFHPEPGQTGTWTGPGGGEGIHYSYEYLVLDGGLLEAQYIIMRNWNEIPFVAGEVLTLT